ncbi:MAG: type I-C CRISPR-associated protein Cas8c/Csd1 [Oscillospiraceae bacterium]|jgi:CRISPR-associated protein Csd1|nr:type I-C CRISPR-associated protein Cas8c/Csd1 [Oscillospiraceae bacterium]
MILQSLVRHYDALAAKGVISPVGWSMAKVSFALELARDGSLLGVMPMKIPSKDGKKEVPQPMRVPEQVKRASGVAANFLCDSGAYLLGMDNKGKPERTRKCFEASRKLHHEILDGVKNEAAEAVLHFFDTWQPGTVEENEALTNFLDEIKAGANLIFKTQDGENVQDDSEVKAAWEQHRAQKSDGAVMMRCLVTGEKAPVARLHPSIKGVAGAQPSGASLVSYNAPAFESYGHEMSDDTGQGLNGPVSELAAFKYTTALNTMTADRNHVQRIADTTVLYWAEDAEPAYQDVFSGAAFGLSDRIGTETLKGVVKALAGGGNTHFRDTELRADNQFYVLGLAPNASRLSVRFFLQNEFGRMLKNLHEHNERLEIARPSFETKTSLPLWNLLNETANQNSKNKTPPPPMAGAVLLSILSDTDYPASLFENIMLRIRAEHDINWQKAAILKAYGLKNREITVPEEVFKVELNEKSDYTPYVLGRLFALLEMVQKTANPGIKATIRNKYFTSASATPAAIFPLLLSLSQHHQRKLSEGAKVYYDKKITDLGSRLRETLPTRFTLQEQGSFYLGYYHEKRALFTSNKKCDSKNEEDESR